MTELAITCVFATMMVVLVGACLRAGWEAVGAVALAWRRARDFRRLRRALEEGKRRQERGD